MRRIDQGPEKEKKGRERVREVGEIEKKNDTLGGEGCPGNKWYSRPTGGMVLLWPGPVGGGNKNSEKENGSTAPSFHNSGIVQEGKDLRSYSGAEKVQLVYAVLVA